MRHDDTIRANIASQLRTHMTEGGITYSDLISATGLDLQVIIAATKHGLVETVDLIRICQRLDLDASAVLAEAYQHDATPVACPLADAPAAAAHQPQPEQYPA